MLLQNQLKFQTQRVKQRKQRDMVSGQGKRTALRRKLQTLRSFTSRTKSIKKSSIFMDALLHIYMLKLKLEAVQKEYLNLVAIKTEYLNLIKQFRVPKEVKVEKIEEGFLVKVKCEKGGDTLVSILEAFEEMGLIVVQARVSCDNCFSMEAIAALGDQSQEQLDVRDVTQAIIKATTKINQDVKETNGCSVVPKKNSNS